MTRSLDGSERMSDILLAGYDRLAVGCQGCRSLRTLDLRGLQHRHRIGPHATVGEVVRRLSCRVCRAKPAMADVTCWGDPKRAMQRARG